MSKNNAKENRCSELFDMVTELLEDQSLSELKFDISKKKCLVTVKGKRENDESFKITKTIQFNGAEESSSREKAKTDPSEREKTVKEMRAKGCKQQEIADALGISQAQVSNILRKEK